VTTDAMPSLLLRLATLLWRLAIAPVTFVVLALLWCLDLGAGSLLAYSRPDLFGSLDSFPFTVWLRVEGPRAWPWSLWVHLLTVLSWLMVASLLLCTVNWLLFRRKRLRGVGELLVHLGFLLVFAGYVLGAGWGARSLGLKIPVTGGSIRVPEQGVELTLKEVRPLYGVLGDVQGEESDLELTGPVGTSSGRGVRLNHPLLAGTTVVYPRGVRQEVVGARLELAGAGTVELRPGQPLRLGDGRSLEVAGLLQQDESRGEAQGPGVALQLRSAVGAPLAVAYLSPAEGGSTVADLAGVRLGLAGLTGPFVAVYDLHRDPGVRLVLWVAVLITIGSLWAFAAYLREGLQSR